MSLHSSIVGQVSPQLVYSNGNLNSRGVLFLDFVGLHGSSCKSSKRNRGKLGVASGNRLTFANGLFANNWKALSPVRAVLDLERVGNGSARSTSSQSQVVKLEDLIAEKGECGVGFIANLENKASYEIVKDALTALGCMEHRGGCGADNDSGDGSGLMTYIPWDLFNDWAVEQGIAAFNTQHTGVGMLFLPNDEELIKEAKAGRSMTLKMTCNL